MAVLLKRSVLILHRKKKSMRRERCHSYIANTVLCPKRSLYDFKDNLFICQSPYDLPAGFTCHCTITIQREHRNFISTLIGSTRSLHSFPEEE